MDRKKDRQKLALRKANNHSTPSSRRHHFVPFTQRIARLKIDPIRRQRNHDDDYEEGQLTSHFRTALERWREINQSDDFAQFSKKVDSLCDSLPQVLHHQQKIIDLLLEYIAKGTTVAAEPLLDLVPRLAQDVQAQFESHFERTVTTITTLAAKHVDLEVVEWSFHCLAWLFKYLERLLVADLCPLYNLLAPLLGKEKQRDFVVRFAAESLSFLVKKASKKPESLAAVVKVALEDVCDSAQSRNADGYEAGVKALFLEAIRGVQEHIHSKGDIVYQTLLIQALEMNDTAPVRAAPAVRVVQGVLGQVIHHTRSETFKPILDVILAQLQVDNTIVTDHRLVLSAQILLLVVGLRRGSRVVDWSSILQRLASYIQLISAQSPIVLNNAAIEVLGVFAVAHQAAPLNVAISFTKVFDEISGAQWQQYFLGFCSLYSELGNDRFRTLLLSHFQKFIARFWEGTTHGLCVLLPRLASGGQLPKGSLKLPSAWTSKIAEDFGYLIDTTPDNIEINPAYVHYLNGLLEMTRIIAPGAAMELEIKNQVYQALLRCLQQNEVESRTPMDILVVGNAFRFIASSSTEDEAQELWPLVCSASPRHQCSPIFLQSILDMLQTSQVGIDIQSTEVETLVQSLLDALSSPSHELRLGALEILQILVQKRDNEVSKILSSAISIERTEPTIDTARAMSMQIRGLAANYHSISSDPWLSRAIPKFCFGLLHVKFSQIVEDACVAFKEICQSREGEEIVCSTAFQWLEGHNSSSNAGKNTTEPVGPPTPHQTDFAGASFQNLKWILQRNMALGASADELLKSSFQTSHKEVALISDTNRLHALKVLRHIPQVAEKRSRSLVPVLLAWTSRPAPGDAAMDDQDDDIADTTMECSASQRWARKEQKAMLALFALFNNPRVLYKSEEVHSALLSLLEHGDAEIQKSALQALFTWKNANVSRYEEDLLKLLDDAKFREQISVFLDVGEGDGSLQADAREAVMPVVLRLLYGRVTTRGKGDQQANRKAVFVLLSRFSDAEIHQFLDIALGPLSQASLVQVGIFQDSQLGIEFLSQRKQFGLLNMLKDLLDTWKSKTAPYASRLIDPVFYCLIRAVRDMAEEDAEKSSHNTLARSVRQVALQCLNLLFDFSPDYEWKPYMATLFQNLINPRLDKLAIETAQAPSALLRMFGTWSCAEQLAPFLTSYNPALLTQISQCISLATAKDEVKRFVTNEILGALITLAESQTLSSPEIAVIVRTYTLAFLDQLALLLRADPPKDLLEDGVQAVVRLAEYTTTCPAEILSSAAFLLQMPARRASHKIKINLLKILLRFLPTLEADGEIVDQIYTAICASFAHFTDRESRTLLSSIVSTFAEKDQSLVETAQLCEGLNSFNSGRLDQPDREHQSKAFYIINEERYMEFSAKQWRLLLGNLMFYIKEYDENDMRDSDATRANASYSLRRFVEAASQKNGEEKEQFQNMIKSTIIAGIEKGLRDQPKDVQVEYLAVLAHIIKVHPEWSVVNDMQTLLTDDEESSFFINIHHTQHHRRIRAMKRLADKVGQGVVSSNNIYHLLIPLIERFIFDGGETATETAGAISNKGLLTAEALRTIGVMVEWIDWQQCRVLLKRFIGYVKTKNEMQETILKLLDSITTSICHSAGVKARAQVSSTDSIADTIDEEKEVEMPTRLSKSMPGKDKMTQYLVQDVITPLSLFLHDKDESYASRRISVAVIVARFLQLLPDAEFQIRLPALLTDTCNILRSKDQGSRDMTRKALTTICTLIGPSSVGFVLRELKSALQRGFYLHVLSFTLHSILETTTPSFKAGDLDYCASDIVAIIMEDVFGNTGKEKEAAEYLKDKNTKKEVKGKKSFDSMQLLASVTSLTHLVDLVRPIEAMLLGRVNLKDVRHIDELLRRIELGLLQNESVRDRDVLIFCYEIIKDTQQITPAKGGMKPSKYLDQKNDKVASNSYRSREAIGRLTRFSLELVRAVLRKHKDLQTPANIAGFMPIIGDALLSNQDDVKLASIRLFTAILNIPLPRIDSDVPVYIAEAARIIEDSATTNDELSQAALKLISAVLRERRSAPVKVKEKTLAILLKKMKPDLQVISQQGVAFNLLRSIIARKIVIPEVYEIIDGDDGVAAISVRDHDRTTRDLARRVYFQFLMEYPQGKGRFAKQLTFLVRNLEYEHAEGRQSVMETLHLMLNKVGDTLVQQIVAEACWPLVSVMINDDSSQCREMASGLVKTVFARADEDWIKNFLALFRRMLEDGTKDVQKRTGLQCWTIYLEVKENEAQDVGYVRKLIGAILEQDDEGFNAEEWQLIYYALHTLLIICKHKPDVAYAAKTQDLWEKVQLHVSFPQPWVKQEAAKLVGMYVADFASANAASLEHLPLVGSHGLKLDVNGMCELAARNLRLLREGVSEELAVQAVRNLAFLGRCFAANQMDWQRPRNHNPIKAISEFPAEEDEDNGSDIDEAEEQKEAAKESPSAIQHLFHRLAGTLRRELRKPSDPTLALYRRPSLLYPKIAALKLVAALVASLPLATLSPSLPTILLPLLHLTDPNITAPTSQDPSFTDTYQSLVDTATEIMDTLRERLGTTVYVKVLGDVRRGVQRKREERRVKRKIDAVSMPERAERVKVRKRGNEKVRRREKGALARGLRRGW
ncbi:hypothetical protein EJ08DRAFT_738486 [Tothia fuscella]|uniref:Uncharacterized protein n=1 Tax=Tothia fuscella TaxID=1048955 RepID=A0A9P4NGP3_9PEZI|nr:hypothetical protein EJ08DRAFT_738486 [Tothia fuscella]